MRRRKPIMPRLAVAVAAAVIAALAGLGQAGPARAAGSAPGAPGANATWNESNVQGFADSLGSASKVWYTLGNGELENVSSALAAAPNFTQTTTGYVGSTSDGSAMLASGGYSPVQRPTPDTRYPSRCGAARPAPAASRSASRTTPPRR